MTCGKCGIEIKSEYNYSRHIKACGTKKSRHYVYKYAIEDSWKQGDKYKCPYCGELYCERGLSTHIWRKHGEGRFVTNKAWNKGGSSWRKGLTKDNDERSRVNAEKVKATVLERVANGWKPPSPSKEFREKLSVEQSLHNRGGKCKWFEVNGYKVQGTWERDLAIKLTDLGIQWHKPVINKEIWLYKIDGKDKRYTPDFYINELGVFLELKGYWWGNDLEKINNVVEQNLDKKLLVIEKDIFKRLINSKNKEEFLSVLLPT